ncbi:MAG: hypothetical protein E6Z21_00970 [Anaerococcus vaginalis]|nr:hypothetical protein [Anaerococcus vaginalis]
MRIRKNIYTKKDVDIIRKTEFEEGKTMGLDIALQQLIVIPMMFLRDKEGYGGGRLENFIDYFKMTMDCLDVKGFKTDVYKLKKKMFLFKYGNEFKFLET